jgi:hypothetical protein
MNRGEAAAMSNREGFDDRPRQDGGRPAGTAITGLNSALE